MEQIRVTIDTHALVWSVDGALNYKLSSAAKQAIAEAEKTGIVYVPTIVLLEMLRLVEKGRLSLSFDEFLTGVEQSKNHQIVPFDVRLLRVAMTVQNLELHDRLIVATAILTNSILISKDRAIGASGVNVLWYRHGMPCG